MSIFRLTFIQSQHQLKNLAALSKVLYIPQDKGNKTAIQAANNEKTGIELASSV